MTLAIEGGQPVRKEYLSYGQQWIDDEDINEVIATLKSPMITQGPKIKQFEDHVARYVGAEYAVAFSNGTAALHAACFAAEVSAGDEVITTPITFVASANCALYVGAKPVFVDIDEKTYNIDSTLIEAHITHRTKAIVAVDFTGQPVAMDEIMATAKKHNLVVIQDAAHSLGAIYKDKMIGSIADMTMFSFHPVKHITTGEGGMIVTNRADYAERLRLFRSHGITRNNMEQDHGPWYYEMKELGYNYRMTDLQAALGISQMQRIEKFVSLRRQWADKYNKALGDIEGISIPSQLEQTVSSWHLYVIRLDLQQFSVGRRQILEALRAENIGVHVHYIPVYRQPYYERLGYPKGLCPISEKWYEEVLTLPLFPKMNENDVESVVQALYKVTSYYRK